MSSDDLEHHRVRVREELDHAYRATSTAAVHAHFKLAALHMDRVDQLVRAARKAGTSDRNPPADKTAVPRPDGVQACC